MKVIRTMWQCDFCGDMMEQPVNRPTGWSFRMFTQPAIEIHCCQKDACRKQFVVKVESMEKNP